MRNWTLYNTPDIHITRADTQKLREYDDKPVSAAKLKAGTLGASDRRSGKLSLYQESNKMRSPSKLDASESVNDNASSMSLPQESNLGLSFPAQYSIKEMGTVRMQEPNVFQAQQQPQNFGDLQFDPNVVLYTNSLVPLVFGNSFVSSFDRPSMFFNACFTEEQIISGVSFQALNYHGQNI